MREPGKQDAELVRPPVLVTTQSELALLVERLGNSPRVAVDTESNSLYAYRERVCLIQFSIPQDDFLVDPWALDDLSALAPIFDAPEIEKVFHAAENDLAVLSRDFGFRFQNLFDTMWAGRILGWPAVGLGHLMEQHFGVPPNKRFQRYNWGKRPLDPEAVSYARTDTHFLLALRDIEAQELNLLDRGEEAQDIFNYLVRHVTRLCEADPETTFWRIKGSHDLGTADRKRLFLLHMWRERTARQLDRPPIKVASDDQLVRIAQTQPNTPEELAAAGLSPVQCRRFGRDILSALHSRPHVLPRPPGEQNRPPDAVLERYQALRGWRKEMALCRGVESDVILPNAALWAMAWKPPQHAEELLCVPGIGPWRQKAYGDDLLGLLRGMAPAGCDRQLPTQTSQSTDRETS